VFKNKKNENLGLFSFFTGLDQGTVTFPVACLFNQNVSLEKF